MEFWMNLMFGNSVGLMSMLVIFGTFLLISAYAVYFIYKVMHAEPPKRAITRLAQTAFPGRARACSVAILRPTKARYTGSLIFMRGACRVS